MVETLNNSKTFKIKNHTIKCSLGIMGMAIPKIPTIIPNRTYTNSWRLTQLSHLKNSTTSEEQDTFNLSSFICFKILGESKQYSPNEERQTNTNTGRRHIDTHHFRPHKKKHERSALHIPSKQTCLVELWAEANDESVFSGACPVLKCNREG